MRTALAALLLAACAPSGTAQTLYDPSDTVLFDAPWPTDDRIVDGKIDLTGFPNPEGLQLLDDYLATVAALDGWGPSAPIYVPFEDLPDAEILPSPFDSISTDFGLILVDIDPDSPGYGAITPVTWERIPRGALTPHPTLAVAPLAGFPLRPGTTHALIVTREIAAENVAFRERLESDSALASLRDALPDLGLKVRDVAVATVFTTRDPLDEMDVIVRHLRTLPPPSLTQTVATKSTGFSSFLVFEGTVQAPLWQHGEKPYKSEGGGFRFDTDGTPLVAEEETLRLAISTPRDLKNPPPNGWPVVLYAHGTGGAYDTFANEGGGLEPAGLMARAGMVGIGFDQPLHGTRGTPNTDVELDSFNYFNPESARANFRQGALDVVWLVHALRQGDVVFTTEDGDTIPIDSSQILYEGHSHGGLTGALAGPWLGGEVRGAVLSGAGGGLAISVIKRKDPFDIADLVGRLVGLGDGEALTPLHPVTGLVQLLAEETDPINYAACFNAVDCGYGSDPLPVLLTSGQHDAQTDHETAEALAVAAALPPIKPVWNRTEAMDLRGIPSTDSPAVLNVVGFDGSPLTTGFSQWEDGDHFVIFRDADAGNMVQLFLSSTADGDGEIDTSP